MKPKLIDRLLVICICFDLLLGFWYVSQEYAVVNQIVSNVF